MANKIQHVEAGAENSRNIGGLIMAGEAPITVLLA
jgi:hypothetical protein